MKSVQQYLCGLITALTLLNLPALAGEPKEVYWEDLVPEGFNELAPPQQTSHDNKMAQLQPNAPVVQKYNNQIVKVPGFVVPLEVRVAPWLWLRGQCDAIFSAA